MKIFETVFPHYLMYRNPNNDSESINILIESEDAFHTWVAEYVKLHGVEPTVSGTGIIVKPE